MYNIAVVDDNEAWRMAIGYSLRQHGYSVETFEDAIAFLQDAKYFDLALIDFSMPPRRYQKEVDGCELICQIKNILEKPPLLVLISAYFTDDVLPQVDQLCPQADAYLSKGSEMTKILYQIQDLLKNKTLSAK